MKKRNYIPALRFAILTRFYDPLVRFSTREFPFKRALLAQANLQNNQTILDLACGTGTLAIAVKKKVSQSGSFCLRRGRRDFADGADKNGKSRCENSL